MTVVDHGPDLTDLAHDRYAMTDVQRNPRTPAVKVIVGEAVDTTAAFAERRRCDRRLAALVGALSVAGLSAVVGRLICDEFSPMVVIAALVVAALLVGAGLGLWAAAGVMRLREGASRAGSR